MPISHQLPSEIESELQSLINQLASQGFSPVASQYSPEAFGNYYVEFYGWQRFRIVKDRSHYSIMWPDWQALEEAGLRGHYRSVDELQNALVAWIETQSRPDPLIQFTLRRALAILTWICITMGLYGAITRILSQGGDPHLALVAATAASLGATIGALFGRPAYGAGIVLGIWFIGLLLIFF